MLYYYPNDPRIRNKRIKIVLSSILFFILMISLFKFIDNDKKDIKTKKTNESTNPEGNPQFTENIELIEVKQKIEDSEIINSQFAENIELVEDKKKLEDSQTINPPSTKSIELIGEQTKTENSQMTLALPINEKEFLSSSAIIPLKEKNIVNTRDNDFSQEELEEFSGYLMADGAQECTDPIESFFTTNLTLTYEKERYKEYLMKKQPKIFEGIKRYEKYLMKK